MELNLNKERGILEIHEDHISDKIHMLHSLQKMIEAGDIETALTAIETWDHDLCGEMESVIAQQNSLSTD